MLASEYLKGKFITCRSKFHRCGCGGTNEEKSFSFEIDGTDFVICRFRDEYFAVENLCSHALARFNEGKLRGHRIMCPLHGATFDIRTGACTGAPATRPIRSFPLRIRDGQIEVDVTSANSTGANSIVAKSNVAISNGAKSEAEN
jgi:3-phenylpropionate/trans-cinnamate dioxygenase ferredoxin subunit